jgi:NAD-reducing hydrogenase small subunit
MDHVRYDYCFPKWEVDDTHRLFGMDHNRCILCTRCVRVCWHIEGAGTKNVSGPRRKARIITDLNQPWGDSDTCTKCGKCVMSCPTGALFPQRLDGGRNGTRPRQTRIHRHRTGEKTMDRIRLATVWFGGCSGCHMSFLDLDEFLIELAGKADFVYSPVMDVKEYPENVDVCLIEGAICNEDNLELLHKIRARTKVLVSFGDCAVTGNVPAMRNQLGPATGKRPAARLHRVRADNPGLPKEEGIVPRLLARVMPVHEAVQVEYFLPGCPPPADRIKALLGPGA